jgi:hypothetical protein
LWVRPRPRGSERAFTDEAGLTVVSFLPSSRRGRLTGPMTIASSGFPARTGALLAMVGWYRLVLQRMDEQMAMLAAVAAAAAGA